MTILLKIKKPIVWYSEAIGGKLNITHSFAKLKTDSYRCNNLFIKI